jgi:hypothetical protein
MSTTIAEIGSGGFQTTLGNPSINDSDTVAFFGRDGTGTGIFRSDGSTPTPIVPPSPFTSFGDNPSLNDGGAVAFFAGVFPETGIFRMDGTTPTTIARIGPSFSLGALPSLNNEGVAAFLGGTLNTAFVSGIFVGDGSPTATTIADNNDNSPFGGFNDAPSINDEGVVAFWASLKASAGGGYRIFTGPDPAAHKVIAVGDALDGSKVSDLTFGTLGREALNNAGQIAFRARLTDGHRGIFRADPVPSEPEVLKVSIDIKPGGNPNPINLKSQGTAPVAILTTDDFDATTVDPTTVTLAGAPVKPKKNGMLMYAYEDVNGDGRVDLAVHVSTHGLHLDESSVAAVLTGQTFDGIAITGSDTVRVVP